ncbi:hypothetical protein [Arenibaculum pallidiluteum]|uniref:hypothetical protein n=1 Tax=Arenibaculum pallidiluteum TaxID=2812559 RepID=UPI001A967DD1|nr:hypothetical protein [Arenibaculum pallidiluteum]
MSAITDVMRSPADFAAISPAAQARAGLPDPSSEPKTDPAAEDRARKAEAERTGRGQLLDIRV